MTNKEFKQVEQYIKNGNVTNVDEVMKYLENTINNNTYIRVLHINRLEHLEKSVICENMLEAFEKDIKENSGRWIQSRVKTDIHEYKRYCKHMLDMFNNEWAY